MKEQIFFCAFIWCCQEGLLEYFIIGVLNTWTLTYKEYSSILIISVLLFYILSFFSFIALTILFIKLLQDSKWKLKANFKEFYEGLKQKRCPIIFHNLIFILKWLAFAIIIGLYGVVSANWQISLLVGVQFLHVMILFYNPFHKSLTLFWEYLSELIILFVFACLFIF